MDGIKSIKRLLDDWVIVTFKDPLPVNHDGAFIQIASYITAKARANLVTLMYRALGCENVLYCDTDSIITYKQLDDRYTKPDGALGTMHLEGIIKEARFIAPKFYKVVYEDGKTHRKLKGVPSSVVDDSIYDVDYSVRSHVVGPYLELRQKFNYMVANDVKYKKVSSALPRRRWLNVHASDLLMDLAEGRELIKSKTHFDIDVPKKDGLESLYVQLSSKKLLTFPAYDREANEEVYEEIRRVLVWLMKNEMNIPKAFIMEQREVFQNILNSYDIPSELC
jgi:hypothetical protein